MLLIFVKLKSLRDNCKSRKTSQKQRKACCLRRLIFLTAGSCILGVSYFLIYGVTTIHHAFGVAKQANLESKILIDDILENINHISDAKQDLAEVKELNVVQSDSFCRYPVENNVTKELQINSVIQNINESQKIIDQYVDIDLHLTKEKLNEISYTTEIIDMIFNLCRGHFWYFKAYVLVLGCLTFFLMNGVFVAGVNASTPSLRCMLSYLILPIYGAVAALSCMLTSVMLGVLLINADFCNGGEYPGDPGDTVLEILKQQRMDESSGLHYAFTYYLGGCTKESPIAVFYALGPELQELIYSNEEFLIKTTNNSTRAALTEVCGESETAALTESVSTMIRSTEIVQETILRTMDRLSCSRILPIYEKGIVNATCSIVPKGMILIVGSFLIISIFTFLLITLRASWQNEEVFNSDFEVDELELASNTAYWNASAPEQKSVVTFITAATAESEDITQVGGAVTARAVSPRDRSRFMNADDVIFVSHAEMMCDESDYEGHFL